MQDRFLDLAQRPAADLTPDEQAFLVRYFFSANWATMVRPYRRYHELLMKRGVDLADQDLPRVARAFSTQELLDLQVWHNLAWIGYGTVRRYPRVAMLRDKDRGSRKTTNTKSSHSSTRPSELSFPGIAGSLNEDKWN